MDKNRFTPITRSNAHSVIAELKRAPYVAFDTETTGLYPQKGDQIRLMQFATSEGTFILDAFQVNPHILFPLFDGSVRFVGMNIAFDFRFMMSIGIMPPTGVTRKGAWAIFDLMIASQVLHAGIMPRPSHSFAAMVERELGKVISKEEQRSDWSNPDLTDEQLEYACTDVEDQLPLVPIMEKKLEQMGAMRAFKIEMRALPAIVWLTSSGMPIVPHKWEALAVKYSELVNNLEFSLAEFLYGEEPGLFGWADINWHSPLQALNVFNRRFKEQGKPLIDNTDDDTLGELAANGDELAKMLMLYREKSKARDTYGHEWLRKHLGPRDRIFAEYRQIGAYSGRMSANNPNIQQIPRTPEFRECFEAPSGRVFVVCDYSQIELRIVVEYSKDPAGIQAYCVDKSDLHKSTANLILKSQDKDARQVAKSLNFGLIFGAGAETLRTYAQSAFKISLPFDEAVTLRNAWRSTYKGIVRWQKEFGVEGRITTRTMSDRPRQHVTKFTEKLNTPVQGTGADGLKAAMGLCWERRGMIPANVLFVAAVHDELVFECDEADAPQVGEWVKKNMEEAMGHFLKLVPVVAEPSVAKNWSEK